jgi:hypothetical protein
MHERSTSSHHFMKRATQLLPLVVVWVTDNVTPMCPHRDKFNQPLGMMYGL